MTAHTFQEGALIFNLFSHSMPQWATGSLACFLFDEFMEGCVESSRLLETDGESLWVAQVESNAEQALILPQRANKHNKFV